MSQINESAIATPGVYVTEIDSFPPSVAQVATAIPVFIGYTEFATDSNGKNVTMQAVHISSWIEYTRHFGGGPELTAIVYLNDDAANSVNYVMLSPSAAATIPPSPTAPLSIAPLPLSFQVYNSVQMFYNQGGGDCYILSVAPYPSSGTASYADFKQSSGPDCFDIVQKNDVITLIVIPDAVMLTNQNDFNNLMTSALSLCGKLQDRFTIMDIYNGYQDRTYDNNDVITNFRTGVLGANLSYGAAYYPWLNTSLPTLNSFSFLNQNISLYQANANPIVNGSTVFASTNLGTIISGVQVTQMLNAIGDLNNFILPKLEAITGLTTPSSSNAGVRLETVEQAITTFTMPSIASETDLVNWITNMSTWIVDFIAINDYTFQDNNTQVKCQTYILPSSGTNYTQLESLMAQIIIINSAYPVLPVPITPSPSFADSHLPTLSSPYGTLTTGTSPAPSFSTIIGTVLPALNNAFNGLASLMNNLLNDVLNLISSYELQLIANNSTYANIITAANASILVPPSGAIAGIYAATDGTRGVWKAPANVSLNNVISPAVNIDDDMQGDLNIDTNAGKSINAIRAFTGKGTLVWGARTLAGNDNNWRYVPVRRFFIMVEESVKLACFQFVFEPNVNITWLRLRAMIENYLTGLWRRGAITGTKPEQGFYVKVGLGVTMTQDDILNGRLIVEIGIAPVRPAEFIILRFTQTQQQA